MDKNQLSKLLSSLENASGSEIPRLKNEWIQIINQHSANIHAINSITLQTAQFIMRLREVNNPDRLRQFQDILMRIVLLSTNSRFIYGLEALRAIFNVKAEFYDYNNLDRTLEFPIGKENPLPHFVPELNEECDAVRPYLSCTSAITWTRCLFLGINQNGIATVKFSNLNDMISIKTLLAPLNSRCFDHDWRMGLNVGDLVDAQDDRLVWCLSTVLMVIDNNGIKQIKVGFRQYHQQGDKKDQNGTYFGWGSNKDQVFNVMSPRIQSPHRMHKRLDYNIPSTSAQFIVEDSYDILYEQDYKVKPFYSIMRTNYNKSQTLVSLFNVFVLNGGLRTLIQLMNIDANNVQIVSSILWAICNNFYLIPRMALSQTLGVLLPALRDWSIKNIKNFNAKHYQLIFYNVIIITLRIMSYSQASDFLEELKKQLFSHLILQNLDKKLIALRILFDLMKPTIPFTIESKQRFVQYLKKNNVFQKVYQYGVHDQILPRTKQFLKFYMDANILHFRQLQHLWKLIPFSDLVGRAALEKLLSQVSQQMNHQEIEYLVAKILQIKQTDLTVGNLGLLKVLKDKVYSRISIMKMLEYLWDLITVKASFIKVAVESEAEIVFKGFISSLKDNEIKFHLLKKMVKTLKQSKNIQVQLDILHQYLKTFKQVTENPEAPHIPKTTIQIVKYLSETEEIYDVIMKFVQHSNSNTEQTKSLLRLLNYLISVDPSVDSSILLRDLFFKLDDKQLVLKMAKQLATSFVSFSEWLFSEIEIVQTMSKLSLEGFEAVKQLFLQLNAASKSIVIKYGKVNDKTGTRSKFIYVMIEPHELKGMMFLDSLLKTVIDSATVQRIIQFLVSLIVNLDESLFDRTIQVRKTILKNIVNDISNLAKPPLTDRTVNDIQKNILIIKELFSVTEVKGLFDLVPHLESIEGDPYHLKILNHIPQSKALKQFSYAINENKCLWRLQQQLAAILVQQPMSINIQKANVNTVVSPTLFGTPFTHLPIWKDQTLIINRNNPLEIPKQSLLNQRGNGLSQNFQKVVESWFFKYQSGVDALTAEDLHKFNNDFSRKAVQEKVTMDILQKYDTNKDMILTLEEFKRYFYDRATSNLNSLWGFLNINRYMNNLRKISQQPKQLGVQCLPRSLLSDSHVFQQFFAVFKNPSLQAVHQKLYNLIISLPTNKDVEKALQSDYNVLSTCQNIYEYNYLLDILIKKLKKLQFQFFAFAANGGIEFLLEKIQSYNIEQGIHILNGSDEIAFAKILGIINLYFYIDQADNKIFSFLFNFKGSDKTLIELKQALDKQIKAPQQSMLLKKKTMLDMKIQLDYNRITKVYNKFLKSLIAKKEDKGINKVLVAQIFKLAYLVVCSKQSISIQGLISGILCKSTATRKLSTSTLYLNTLFNAESQEAVTNILLNNIPNQKADVCTQFFDLLSIMIQKSIDKINTQINLGGIVQNIINSIITIKTGQKRNEIFSQNKILKGQLQLINAILKKKPQICQKMSKYKMIFMRKCLFFYNAEQRISALKISKQHIQLKAQEQLFADYPSCKSHSNRKLMYETVNLLQKANPDPTFVEQYLLPIISELKQKVRKPGNKGYAVGLYNFGSTCYMNAMLQILGRIKPFRNGLLMADQSSSKVQNQLEHLYSHLFYSQRQDYMPERLLSAFEPAINPMVQQDTTQFLSFLFNHIEKDLKDTPYRHLIDGCFQGMTVLQMICHNCGAKKQKDQPFYYYQVGVKERNTLGDALQHNSQGEVISDWQCEFCNKKSDITRKTVLKQTPNVMFIHLQRIIFDFDRYMNTKIHTHLQFPEQLNIEPYIKQGIELRESVGLEYIKNLSNNQEEAKKFKERCLHGKKQEDYLLDLVGVIIHSGTADAGHYYSFAKQVPEKTDKTQQKKQQKQSKVQPNWIRLDDSSVTFSSKVTMFSECFGGSFSGDWGFEYSKNAYVLVYQRRVKKPIELVADLVTKEDLNKFPQPQISHIVDYNSFPTYNTQRLFKQVWLDNHNLMVETHLLGDNYGKQFIQFLGNILQNSNESCVGEVISQTLFKIIPLLGEQGKLMEIFEKTTHGFQLFSKYLDEEKKIVDMLFHNDRTTRIAFSKYLAAIVINSLRNQLQKSHERIILLINFLIDILNTEVAKNWIKAEGYFYFFYKIIYESVNIPYLYNYLVLQEIIFKWIDFILAKQSPFKFVVKKHQVGNKHAFVDFTFGIHTIFTLLQKSLLFLNANLDGTDPKFLFHLSDRESLALGNMEFYGKMIRNKVAPEQVAGIIQRLAIHNHQFSIHVVKLLLTILTQAKGSQDIINVVNLSIKALLQIQDMFAYQRLEMILGCGNQTQLKKDNRIYSIQQQVYSFTSSIENLYPAQPLLYYCYANKTLFPLSVFNIFRIIIEQSLRNKCLLDFLAKQPAVNYLHTKYYEWIRHYVLNVKSILNLDKVKVQEIDKQIQQILKGIQVIEVYDQTNNLNPTPLIAGSILDTKTEYKLQIQGYPKVFQQLVEHEVYGVESHPNHMGDNKAFGNHLSQFKIRSKNVDESSNILFIMKETATSSKEKKGTKIQKTWAAEEETDIQPFFSEFDDVTQQAPQNSPTGKIQGNQLEQQNNTEEQPVNTINIQNIVSNNYYRQIIIENSSEEDIWVVIQFDKVNPFETNCLLPSKCSSRVRAGYRQVLILMSKFDYQKPWIQFQYRILIDRGDKYSVRDDNIYSFRLYGELPKLAYSSEQNIPAPDQSEKNVQIEMKQENNKESEAFNEDYSQKPCPACTYLNLSILNECQACGSPLN